MNVADRRLSSESPAVLWNDGRLSVALLKTSDFAIPLRHRCSNRPKTRGLPRVPRSPKPTILLPFHQQLTASEGLGDHP